ncbi:histone-lysine N-methyltransferase trithorax [Cydia pomonella]|uniref:histone-lysine N-methyltransferase trithorax n=1 Tax=Cydia pomonella TaxID=82600 RepID=UPI002ADD3A62|nr:histone-lysine N-methyltransferase trithorax [Cydia pomonella]
MGRSRFPGKPLKFQNRKRVSVLSGAVYHENAPESQPLTRGGTANVFAGDKEEEEKKENSNENETNGSSENLANISAVNNINNLDLTSSDSKSPVRTRSQNKMEPVKLEKPKSVKKTVTFGTVESCEDIFLPLKKIPLKHHAPLVPIIKKKSSLKQTEYSTFNSILKPAKLTDLSSKSSDNHEGYLRKNLNPLSKPMNKFSQFSDSRCISPPPRNLSPVDKESGSSSKFVLPVRSTHSSRVIKPNKRFIDGEEPTTATGTVGSAKVLKKPKLKRLLFNNLHRDDDTLEDEASDVTNDTEKPRDKQFLTPSNLFKDKTTNSFSGLSSNTRKPNVKLNLFSNKETEYSQDENSNVEGVEKGKALEQSKPSKEERAGHAMRKLMDISDASSSTSTSSGSESEESWDSDSLEGSGDEEEKPPPSPEREKSSASQLLSGKVIIREARLQLNTPAQATTGLDGPFSAPTSTSPNPPTTVTCGVCGAVRFYKFVKQARKFGIYSCESCRKFITKLLKREKLAHKNGTIVMQCMREEGNCIVPPIVRSQQWKLVRSENRSRCPACWLKMCLRAFQVPPSVRAGLTAMLPPSMRASVKLSGPIVQVNPLRLGAGNTWTTSSTSTSALTNAPPNNTENEGKSFVPLKINKRPEESNEKLIEKVEDKTKKDQCSAEEDGEAFSENRKRRITRVKVRKKDKGDSKQSEDPKRQKVELKGPRVKHVCRSASIVLGQPIATFPTQEEKEKQEKSISFEEDNSLLPAIEKDVLATKVPSCDIEMDTENKAPAQLCEVTPAKEADIEMQEPKKRKIQDTELSIKVPSKQESSEDETVMDLVPKKTVMKPLTNITNMRGRSQKFSQNRPELICVDFWESYDPDEVCSSGFGVIGTTPFTVARLCFLCGSAGKEKMLVCSSCCEWYHTWCAEDSARGGWTCARCVSCAACARPAARLRCRSCARHYHAACLPEAPPQHRSDWPQICSTCLKCKSCDSGRVSKFVGSLPFCGPCFKLRQKGNYCPLCQACYRDNDFDSKMMECGWCARWVHASCEGLSGEEYQLLSALPPSIEYICCKCMPNDPPWRKMLTEHLKGRLLHLLKLLAKNRKACALLKLTPHKNTPVPNKPYRIMSPQAIRKLHFGGTDDDLKNTSETKVYRNSSRGRRNNFMQKSDDLRSSQIWHCSSLLAEDDMEKEGIPHPLHKVVNLQEPLMQNKEICFTTGLFGTKTEFDTPCVEVHENNPIQKTEKATTMLPTTVHDDKYEAISDDDEPAKSVMQARSEQELSPAVIRNPSTPSLATNIDELSRIVSPSLLDIKKRVNSDEYVSLKDFNHDMREVINRTINEDLKRIYKELFSETFPWFDCENNCLQPNLEVEREQEDTESLKDHEMTDDKHADVAALSIERPIDQIVPKLEVEGHNEDEDLLEFYPVVDSRTCVLCKIVGDGSPAKEGRLLYCGQNDWIHANCALWSAEVFEEIDGSLQNVHSAISRGKMIKCAACEIKGASVGCCAKNCSETYHYACARRENCAFMDDKRVFCPTHGKDVPKVSLQKDADFELTRPVYVELDKKKKRYSEIKKVQFLMGSLTVNNLGKIVPPVSDYDEYLMPVDFSCTRLFWSCKKPLKIVRYNIKTKLILAEPMPGFDFGVNITVDHSTDMHVVDRVMAEIGAWHQSLETGTAKPAFMLKNDKSPIKFGNALTLEDLAVKQVVEHLLDNVCKQEQQDEEEPQNTADLLPPELKDAIFEDLNHDLLDGISMQDIFPKLMSYEDLVAMDLKNEFYGAIGQSDDKNSDARSTTDFIDELLNARLESGSKELKRSKSEMLLQNHNLKSLSTGRGQQRSSSLTWNNKFDTSLLSSTIKRCKINQKTSTVTGKPTSAQRVTTVDNALEPIKEIDSIAVDKKVKSEPSSSSNGSSICEEAPHTSGINYRATSPKPKDESKNDKSDKSDGYYAAGFIDFYTKIQCSPISQLDGTADWSGSESTCSSRPNSPRDDDFSPISQLDGAEDHPGNESMRNQTNQFLYRASGSESTYTVTIAGNSISGQPELIMRPLDDGSGISGQIEQPVRCDRCQCTYRNKESYERHVPSCDMMSTSESESENPKSPENRTLTTLQNAFQGAFAQPMIIHTGVVSNTENTVKAESISARRTSINTRQITINGTIVETPSPGPANEMTMTITEQMKSGTVIFDQSKSTNVQVSANQQVLSSPQIVVTPQMLLPPKTSSAGGQKIMAPQIITQPGVLPYNICVKPGNTNSNIQQIQSGTDMAQLLSGAGGIQVISSNSNQVLTIPSNQGNITTMVQGKSQVANFPNMASASSLTLPVNSIQGMPNASIIQNIQPMIRPQIQGNPTIVVPAMTAQRLTSPNTHKQHIILPGNPQKSPKKQPAPVQPKPIFQATNRGRGRPIPKPTTIKRQTKLEKTFTTINQSPIGASNTVIQLQTNNQSGQPSIIVQPVANQNIMSAYVEALSQQQNQNMQYIATIGPQGDFKTTPTQFISQSGLMPQTFQIQQTESGGLVAVPSGGIPVLLPQGNVGILPQAIQQGATILPQGALQTQGIISQGPNGPTILPQTIHTQNGATIIPQGTIQGLTPGNMTSQTATLLPNNTLQAGGATVVPQSGIGNGQNTILPNAIQSQGNTLISSGPGATILPQGTLLPQFCNDQVILGSTPTLEMVTDPSGCMYLTTTQPVYYGLETIVQNTVMSSQQFVSTAMQGVLAQNSSFSATTTQVFQASKIEPIVEVPTGYVVVNNVGDGVNQAASSAANVVTAQTVQSSPQSLKVKTPVPNLTLQPLPDKIANNNANRQTPKVIQMSPVSLSMGSHAGPTIITGRQNINPITSQIHGMTISSTPQQFQRSNLCKPNNVSMSPSVTLVSSTGQPVMAISQSVPHSVPSFSIQSIPISQPIVSSSIAPSINKNNMKIENSHVIEISGNLQEISNSSSMPTISVTQSLKSPTPWKQLTQLAPISGADNKIELQNMTAKTSNANAPTMNMHNNISNSFTCRPQAHNESEKVNQNILVPMSNNSSISGLNIHSQQFESTVNVSHHTSHSTSNNVIQITAGNIYPPCSAMNSNFDADTSLKLSKINALSKAEGGHINFSQEIMASHSQQHSQSEKAFQNMGTNENKQNMDTGNNQVNIHKLNSCQVASNINNLMGSPSAISIIPHTVMRPQMHHNQNTISVSGTNQLCTSPNATHGQLPILNSGNNTHQNMNIVCEEISNNRLNSTVTNESAMHQNNQQHEINASINTSNLPHGNMQIIPHENTQLSNSNQIHIMNGQIQHARQMDNSNQLQQLNQGSLNRSFHENISPGQQSHSQTNMLSNRNTPDNNLINHSMNMHSINNNHNMNRQANDLNHMHNMSSSMQNLNNMQNNRMVIENMQPHGINNMGHQMHTSRSMDGMHNSQLHSMQQINHHMNSNRPQIDSNNMQSNQQMAMQQNRPMENAGHHHQHQIPNLMQMQNNRAHIENSSLMGMHQHLPNQIHNRQQMDNNMHMHHMSSGASNMSLNNQIDNSSSISNLHSNRHDSSSIVMQNLNAMNQIPNNRSSMDHPSLMQHQINNMNNGNMHNNGMQIGNNSNLQMNNSMIHGPNIPDIKNEISNPCSGSCSGNNTQYSNNQSTFELCSNMSTSNNMNLGTSNVIHGMGVNNSNMSNNNIMNNNGIYGVNTQNTMMNHDMLMNCNNASELNINNIMPNNPNHMMMNNSQSHTSGTQNQILGNQVNNAQININSCSMNTTNNSPNQIANIDSQLSRPHIPVNDKFGQDNLRGKNIMGPPTNTNLASNDSPKVNIVNTDKQNHTISMNSQMGFMQMNTQNNRVINLPERNRLSNATLDNNMNQHVPQQHNIRVVTNNSSNSVPDPLTFQQKNESSGTMINVPFQAIPNSAPMNINVNSSNNTVNITVQNNLVDPKIASKSAADISFPLQSSASMLQNQSGNSNMICIPVPNNTISLPTQNSSSITLPKAPPTQQSGIPTNVVNPMSMRPMNRVLPLHRDGQSKSSSKNCTSTSTKTSAVHKQRTVSHDMPDLNIKDETIDSDLEKAIEESKRMMELEKANKEKEEMDAARAIQLSTEIEQASHSSVSPIVVQNSIIESGQTTSEMTSLPNLDTEIIEVEPPKVLQEKDTNKVPVQHKLPSGPCKVTKRPINDRKIDSDVVATKKPNKVVKGQENKGVSLQKSTPEPPKDDGPKLIYEVTSEDGFNYSSTSLTDLWAKVIEAVQNARKQSGLPLIQYNLPSTLSGAHLLGLNNNALKYLIEQLPGASRCTKYKLRQGRPLNSWDNDLDLSEGFKESPWGSARTGPIARKASHDMFSWMASPFREEPPPLTSQDGESSISRRLATLPPAMRFRQLKETSKASVGVYRSHIHGRGLFCKREIEEGDMVIEYAGEVIRAVLADQREKRYEAMSGRRGVGGCYMFRIDDNLVVDATLKGNAARFINHSCDPNCYSRVVDIHGHKHILIFALRRISIGEELTYDYKFPFEEVKIPCTCGAKKCRKYLN